MIFHKHLYWKTAVVTILCIFFLAVTGCSGPDNKSGKKIKACTLLTLQEIESITGASIDPPKATEHSDKHTGFWMSQCNWFSPDTGISLGIMIRPLAPEGSNPETAYETMTQSLKKEIPGLVITPLAGMGKKAALIEDMGQILIFDETYSYIITVISSENKIAMAKALSNALMNKMNH